MRRAYRFPSVLLVLWSEPAVASRHAWAARAAPRRSVLDAVLEILIVVAFSMGMILGTTAILAAIAPRLP